MLGSNYIWEINVADEIQRDDTDLHPAILQLLKQRGIESPESIKRFMNPKLDYLYNPMLMKDMAKAVERIKNSLARNEKITVYGDYDVDGITGCCLLVKLLRKMGGVVDYYIPSRLEEGYGLNTGSVKKIYDNGTKLIITVDNGITSFEETQYASSLGIDVIVTDHHEPRETIPQAVAVVNPKRSDCSYPFKGLAGVGVALKVAHALSDMDNKVIYDYLDFAALGTIADIVPLLDENRIIVKNGLSLLANTKNKGLQSIMSVLNLNDNTTSFNVNKISYLLAPRINAVGRMGNADLAIELLLTEDEDEACELAKRLEGINSDRQAIESRVYNEVKAKLSENTDNIKVIVLSSIKWHPGVLGIVASKIAEEYHKPCILISLEGNEGRGSGRSIQDVNLFKILDQLSHLLIKYGGHEQAVGLTISADKIEDFKRQINQVTSYPIETQNPTLEIDLELKEGEIDLSLAEQLELMEPFGFGNPKPIFICKNMLPYNVRTVGDENKHLKLYLKDSRKSFDAIGFNLGIFKKELSLAPTIDVAFNLEINRWRGIDEPQFKIKDIRAPYLRDELLLAIENGYFKRYFYSASEKLFDMIFAQGLNDLQKTLVKRKIFLNDKKSDIQKMQFIKSIFEKDGRVLVIVNTPYQAWRLLAFLSPMSHLKKQTEALFNFELADEISKNTILINPIVESFPSCFDTIIVYDAPFSLKILNKQIIASTSTAKLILIFNPEDLRDNYTTYKKVMPSADEIKALYGLLKKINNGKVIGRINLEEIYTNVCDLIQKDIHMISIINVFKILQELNIIQYEIKGGLLYIKNHMKPENKLNIITSDTYRNFLRAKQCLVQIKDNYACLKDIIKKKWEEKIDEPEG